VNVSRTKPVERDLAGARRDLLLVAATALNVEHGATSVVLMMLSSGRSVETTERRSAVHSFHIAVVGRFAAVMICK
jgi:hypothetical protein